jgi:hypothetical protein
VDDEMGRTCSTHVGDEEYIYIYIKFRSENQEGRQNLEGLGIDGRIILECMLEEQVRKAWAGFIWLWIVKLRVA